MLGLIARLLKVLNSEDSEQAISWAITLALVFALLPLFSGVKWLVLLVVIMLRIHLATFILFAGIFALLAYLLDPMLNQLGLILLQHQGMHDFWLWLYRSSLGSVLAINNTLALASLLVSLTLTIPLYFFAKWLVVLYRVRLKVRIERLRVVQLLKTSKLYSIYQQIS